MRVEWSPLALDRVFEIADYIAADSPANSEAWVERIFDHVDTQLSRFPMSGKPARDVDTDEARELVFESYRVFYDVGDCVEILTVRRCSELVDGAEIAR
jgi:toxin ParE1/3/4